MEDKKTLRKNAILVRNSLDIRAISDKIVNRIRNFKAYQEAENVMIFYPLKNEINLLKLLDDKKQFFLPKVEGENLLVCPYSKNTELIKSKYNTFEPIGKPVSADVLDLIFIPALMVDENYYRLGYGGGFYDRFLSKPCSALKIVPIASQFLARRLPHDDFDEKINVIICEDFVMN